MQRVRQRVRRLLVVVKMTALFILKDGRKELRQLRQDMQEYLESIPQPLQWKYDAPDVSPSFRVRRYRRAGRGFDGVPIFIDTDDWADVKECR